MKYEATIHIDEAGKYRFHSRSDDGCWLRVDGKVVFASSTSHFQENYGDVKLSVRAVPGRDATALTGLFGGGGHKGAAGASMNMTMDEAVKAVIAELPVI